MKKILLTAINARFSHSNLALMYLRGAAEGLPFEVEIAEYTIKRPVEEIAHDISVREPHAVALSVYIWNSSMIKKLAPIIKSMMPESLIIMGGPEVSFNPEKWLSEVSSIDFIVTGPGEAPFRRLLESDLRHGDRIISGGSGHFSQIPFPYRKADFDRLRGRYIYYESSRGCPFRCSYCLSSRQEHRLESRSIEDVKRELDFMASQGPRYIKFVARTFNCARRRCREIWRYIIESFSGMETCFHFEVFPALLEDEDFRILAAVRPGLMQFEMGIQSIHEKTLSAVNRNGSWPAIRRNIQRLLSETHIHAHVDLIAGLPFEDIQGVAESFNEIYLLSAHHFQMGFLKVLPGTEMSQKRDEFGISNNADPPYEISESRWLSAGDIRILHGVEEQMGRLYNSGHFKTTLSILESLYPDPFNMFTELARYAGQKCSDPGISGGWESAAADVIALARDRHPVKHSLIMDSLRWDWCILARSHRYPKILIDDEMTRLRKDFLKSMKKDYGRDMGSEHPDQDMDRAAIFIAVSDSFSQKFMEGRRVCLFLREGKRIFAD